MNKKNKQNKLYYKYKYVNFHYDYFKKMYVLNDSKYIGIIATTKTKNEMKDFIKTTYFNRYGKRLYY